MDIKDKNILIVGLGVVGGSYAMALTAAGYKNVYAVNRSEASLKKAIQAGIVKGADKILAALEKKLGVKCGECTVDGLFSLDSCRCVGACGLAPVMMIDDDVYGKLNVDMLDDILQPYREGKK